MASLTKTFSGDLTTFLAGKIWDKIKEVNDDDRLKKASPEVKKAAKELDKEDQNDVSFPVKDQSLRDLVSKLFGAGLDSKMMVAEAKIDKLATGIQDVGAGIADTQKLVINQNEIIESKFDEILEVLGVQNKERKENEEKLDVAKEELGIEEGEFSASSRQLLKALAKGKSGGGGILGYLLKRQGYKLLRHLSRRFIPRRIRARGRMLRGIPNAYKRKAISALTRRLPSSVSKLVTREGGELLAKKVLKKKLIAKAGSKAVGKKIPIAGALIGTGFAIERLIKGDVEGAVLEFASGLLGGSGAGIAGSIGIDAYLMDRDLRKSGAYQSGTGKSRTKEGLGEFHGTELKIPGGRADSIVDDYKSQLTHAGSLVVSTAVAVGRNLGVEGDIRAKLNTDGIDFPIEQVSYRSDLGRIASITSGVSSPTESIFPNEDVFGSKTSNKSNSRSGAGTTKDTGTTGTGSGVDSTNIAYDPNYNPNVRVDASGESGVDFTPAGPNNRVIFPGTVTEIGHQYNPNKIGGDDRQGSGYGNFVVVTSVDPVNNKEYDGLYAHFPKGSIQVSVGDQVEYGDILGPMATVADYADPVTRREVGSGTGPHTSLDFLMKGSTQAYPHWKSNLLPRIDASFNIKPPKPLPEISEIDVDPYKKSDGDNFDSSVNDGNLFGLDTGDWSGSNISPPSNITNNVDQVNDGSMFVKNLVDTAISRTNKPVVVIKNANVDVDRTVISRSTGGNNDDWIDTYRTLSLVS